MKLNPKNNPMTQRLGWLRHQWDDVHQSPAAEVVCWQVTKEERPVVEAFTTIENSEEGVFPDFFLTFQTPFENAAAYGPALGREFRAFLNQEAKALQEEGITVNVSLPKDLPDLRFFWQALADFGAALPEFTGRVIACLSPGTVRNAQHWKKWLGENLANQLPAGVGVLLLHEGELAHLAAAHPGRITNLVADLDIPGAVRELAASGDPKEPGVRFRKLFVALNEASGRKDVKQVEELGGKALRLAAGQTGWEPMQLAVLMAVSMAMLGAKKHQEALGYNQQALAIAQNALAGKHPGGPGLVVQVLFCKGSLLLTTGSYQGAAVVYEAVVPYTEGKDLAFQRMEAWRMAGHAHAKLGNLRRAWECNLAALDTAELLEENLRKNSTLPIIGEDLLQLSHTLGYYAQAQVIRERLGKLLGGKWAVKKAPNPVQL